MPKPASGRVTTKSLPELWYLSLMTGKAVPSAQVALHLSMVSCQSQHQAALRRSLGFSSLCWAWMSMASYGIHEFLVLRDIAWFLLLGILLEEAKGRGDVAVAKLQVVAIGVTHNDLPFTVLKSFHQVLSLLRIRWNVLQRHLVFQKLFQDLVWLIGVRWFDSWWGLLAEKDQQHDEDHQSIAGDQHSCCAHRSFQELNSCPGQSATHQECQAQSHDAIHPSPHTKN